MSQSLNVGRQHARAPEPDMPQTSNQGEISNESKGPVYLGLPGAFVSYGTHIAHLFLGVEERWRVLAPFMKAGLEAGDQCLLVTETSAFSLIKHRLIDLGLDDIAVESNQLILSEGSHRRDWLASTLRGALARGRSAGRRTIRVGADMTWAIGKMSVAENLIALEAVYHRFIAPRTDFVALCQYDVSRFDGGNIMGAVQTHPMTIIGNCVENNPFYRDPRAVLRGLSKEKRALRQTSRQ